MLLIYYRIFFLVSISHSLNILAQSRHGLSSGGPCRLKSYQSSDLRLTLAGTLVGVDH